MFVYALLVPMLAGLLTPAACSLNSCCVEKRIEQREVLVKAYLGTKGSNKRRSYYRVVISATNESFIFRIRWTLDCPNNTPAILYVYKGWLGLYAVDSLKVSYDGRDETVIAQ